MTRRGLALRPVDGGHRPSHTTEFRDTILVYVEIYRSARKHGIDDSDIDHAVEHALAVGELDDGKVLYLGPGRAGDLLEVWCRCDATTGPRS